MAANAVDEPYTPAPPSGATLAGSVVVSDCVGDVPWIRFSLSLDDPDNVATGNTATLVITNGTNNVSVPLGQLVDGKLKGSVLWPGASVDSSGNPTGWPGWMQQNGEWVQTSGNFAWTRGGISAVVRVNPDLSVPLSYPRSSPECATGPTFASISGNPADLAATGMNATAVPIALGVGGVLLIGGIVLVARRRIARR
ncbi:LPXTG cell wall anchor domain-containing protein [Microbacterium sp.]|uniref:LPXTG cell wall anchor domain-containing protein n=1 Tax=Microbacterium sp. TaxID=51671 RepID=UPI002D7FEB18|nr:LPXTG cell wall anchor domain-containing protein [Microbacterium sp.]